MSGLVNTVTGEIIAACSADEARDLTDRIKSHAESLWSLLLEAHDRQAWRALGYGSWRDYAQTEFGMSQAHAYRLLDQGRVIREIEAASGVSPNGEISEAAARDLKPHLDEIAAQIRGRVDSGEDPQHAVAEVVQTTRQREVAEREQRSAQVLKDVDPSFVRGLARDEHEVHAERQVINAINTLADVADPDAMASRWDADAAYHLDRLDEAAWVLDRLRAARKEAA